jgi:hypothetical protein
MTAVQHVEPPDPKAEHHELEPSLKKEAKGLFDPDILKVAVVDSFKKLDPRLMAKNPVMFVVEVGSVLTTILFIRDFGSSSASENCSPARRRVALVPVLFANLAEAMAEGQGKASRFAAQGRADTVANVRRADGTVEQVASPDLQLDDECIVVAGELVPGDGEIIDGARRSTSRPSPVSRLGDPGNRAATGRPSPVAPGCCRTRSSCGSRPGRETFLDRMIALVEGPAGRRPQRDRPQHPALGPHDHLPAGDGHAAAVRHLGASSRSSVALLVYWSDHHRRVAVGDRDRGNGPAGAAQRARHVGSRGRSGRRLLDPAARQDGHDHPRQPPGL